MNTIYESRLNVIKVTLWCFVGVAAGIVLAPLVGGATVPLLTPAAAPALWLGLAAFLVFIGGLALELAKGQSFPAARWLALVMLLIALAWGNAPILPLLATLGLTFGIVSAVALVVLFVIERFAPARRSGRAEVPPQGPTTKLFFGGMWLSRVQMAAMALIVGAVVGVAAAELADLQAGPGVAARTPRTVDALRGEDEVEPQQRLALPAVDQEGMGTGNVTALLIDGNWGDKVVLFDHEAHRERQGGKESCGVCHHCNLPLDRGTSCAACHVGMTATSNAFRHGGHVGALGGNESCTKCHPEGVDGATTIASASCGDADCHGRGVSDRTVVKATMAVSTGEAPSYVDAMHGLCIGCHKSHELTNKAQQPYLSRCTVCHKLQRNGPSDFGTDVLQFEAPAESGVVASHEAGAEGSGDAA